MAKFNKNAFKSKYLSQTVLLAMLAGSVQLTNATIAIGDGVNLGTGATVDDYSIAIGKNSNATINHGVAVGENSTAGNASSAYGYNSNASGTQSVAVGDSATSTGYRGTAIGAHSDAIGNGSTAVGILSQAVGGNSVAVGNGAQANGDYSIATGLSAVAEKDAIAMGRGAEASGEFSTAIGRGSDASAKDSTAIGRNAEASHAGSVALGLGSKADGSTLGNTAYLADDASNNIKGAQAVGEVNIGQYTAGQDDQYRKITGLAAGSEDTDAVNVSQLKAVAKEIQSGLPQNAVEYDDANKGTITLAGSNGTTITNLKPGEVSATSTDAVNGAQLHTVKVDVTNLQSDVNNLTIGLGDVNGRVDQLENKFATFDKNTKAAISSALAVASLPQPTEKGATMLSIGSGFWDGETGFAVGASGVTEDKNLFNKPVNYVWKFASTSNTRSDWGASTAVGVQWK